MKRFIKKPDQMKDDPRVKMQMQPYLDEFPLLKKFLEDEG